MATPVLPPFPFVQTLRLFGACLLVAVVLFSTAFPFIIIGRELWKERVR